MAADPKILTVNVPRPGASDEPPREMTREDRRLIFAKLEEVYIDEQHGYSKGWNDDAVARDMAVPRAWVVLIREENFGPIKGDQSEEVRGLNVAINEIQNVIDHATDDMKRLSRDADQLTKSMAQLKAVIDGANTLLEKARAEMARLTGTNR